MNTNKKAQARDLKPHLPSLETIQQELGSAKSVDDFFGKQGILARLFAGTLEARLEAELTEHLGYERYEAKGRNSGNSRNECDFVAPADTPGAARYSLPSPEGCRRVLVRTWQRQNPAR
jgi:hypothetical protein